MNQLPGRQACSQGILIRAAKRICQLSSGTAVYAERLTIRLRQSLSASRNNKGRKISETMRLLYAEDEQQMAEAVRDSLAFQKYVVDWAEDGTTALELAHNEDYDGIILDIMMPGLDGLTVLKTLRTEGNHTPILLLTAKAEIEDRIEGLELGADDYLPKPFAMGELLARVKAMLRRGDHFQPEDLTFGDLILSPSTFMLSSGDASVQLQNREYQVMETLIRNAGIFLSPDTLINHAWGYESYIDANSLRVCLSGLRKRLAAIGSAAEIQSKRSIGYVLRMKAQE